VEPPTVSIRSVTAPGTLSVREQNYQFDLVSPNALLEKSIGQTVRLRRGGSGANAEYLEGTLLSGPASGGTVLRTADGRLLLNPYGEMEVARMPAGLAPRPSLLWLLEAERGGTQTVEVSYLAGGLGWAADYVAVLDAADRAVDLTGWVTLTNRSGTTWRDAALQLLAGDVSTVTPRNLQSKAPLQLEAVVVTGTVAQRFQEEGLFEYHLYTLDGRTTLANNETKQVGLLSAQGAAVAKRLVFDSRRAWGWEWRPGVGTHTSEVKAAVMEVTVRNHKDTGADVVLVEHFWSEWRILESSHPHERKDAGTAEFRLRVPADSETTLRFRARNWWR
jgi:hypothetical protein